MPANEIILSSATMAEALIQQSPDAYIALSPRGEILFWSHGAESLFGFKSKEALTSQLSDLIVPVDRLQETQNAFNQSLKGNSVLFHSVRTRKDKSWFEVSVSNTPVLNAHGKIEFVAVIQKDITQLKNIQNDRLTEEHRHESQKMETIRRLTEDIAHDFNNILAVISTCTEFLLDDLKENDQKRKDVLQIQDVSSRAAQLVQQLLDFGPDLPIQIKKS